MSRQVTAVTRREQLKSIRLRRRRKELGIDDLAVGVVYDGQRFNAGHGYYGLHLIRRMPDAALEYLYDQALEGKGDPDRRVLEFYVNELRYRAERRTARRALQVALIATFASLLALGIALYTNVLSDRTETPPLPAIEPLRGHTVPTEQAEGSLLPPVSPTKGGLSKAWEDERDSQIDPSRS